MNETATLFADASPRPWKLGVIFDDGQPLVTVEPESERGGPAYVAALGSVDHAESRADAELIVRAVNEYEALLDLERLVRRHHGREVSGESPYYTDCEECRALVRLDEVRAGLAVSRGDA